MADIKLIIDGADLRVNQGTTVLEAAQNAGIYIPTLCYHHDIPSSKEAKPHGFVYRAAELFRNDNAADEFRGCQLCVVEIEGMDV